MELERKHAGHEDLRLTKRKFLIEPDNYPALMKSRIWQHNPAELRRDANGRIVEYIGHRTRNLAKYGNLAEQKPSGLRST